DDDDDDDDDHVGDFDAFSSEHSQYLAFSFDGGGLGDKGRFHIFVNIVFKYSCRDQAFRLVVRDHSVLPPQSMVISTQPGSAKPVGSVKNSMRFENVYVYSKSLQQSKYRYLENLFMFIDEIGYFVDAFSNNSDVIPPNEAHPNSIFIFDDVVCDTSCQKKELTTDKIWALNSKIVHHFRLKYRSIRIKKTTNIRQNLDLN
ncbi:hypothetical protein ALC53_05752, partial [Atta colombica]